MPNEYKEMIINLKKGNKEPIEDRIRELKKQGANEDVAILIAIGEKNGS